MENIMKQKTLQTKDLITVGMFTALYFVLFFATGMLGYIPVLFVLLPLILPVICGIPFMLFLTKVRTFGMVTIMGTILGALMLLTGHTYVPLITGLLFGFLADLILLAGNYASKRLSILGYSVFSLWLLGMLMPFWVMRDSYERMTRDSMGSDYTRAVMGLFENLSWAFPILACIGGLAGGFLGRTMLRKHFSRAGII